MKLLFVSDLVHPEQLTPDEAHIFPPSQIDHFYVKALRALGHEVDAFLRDQPVLFGSRQRSAVRFTGQRTFTTLVSAFRSRFPRLYPDYVLRNRALIAHAQRFQPDAILLQGNNRVILPDTLTAVKREIGCRVVFMNGDSPVVFASAAEREAAPLYDLAIVNDFYHGIQWLELGAQRMEVLPISGCDPEYHHLYEVADEFRCEVGFVGTLLPPRLYSQRVAALTRVHDLGLAVWSIHAVPPPLDRCYRGPALGLRMIHAICGSHIQVNPNSNFMQYGGNMRLFEAAACGVFQLTNHTPGVETWFTPGEHLVTYRDAHDLRRLTEHYIQHPDQRRQIAQAGQQHAYAHHTYRQRAESLVALIQSTPVGMTRLP
jgi:hypothetical protein